MFWYTLLNNVVKVLCRVSVRMKVPEMNVTPRTMAIAVSARRSLWASSPLRVTFHMSASERPHLFEDRIRGRILELAHHGPVGEEEDTIGVSSSPRVVGHHHDRLTQLGDGGPHERQHLGRRVGIEVPGGLVGEDKVRAVDQRPGAGHPLLLPSGHLVGPVEQPVADAELSTR